jgi:hypothetical protein
LLRFSAASAKAQQRTFFKETREKSKPTLPISNLKITIIIATSQGIRIKEFSLKSLIIQAINPPDNVKIPARD